MRKEKSLSIVFKDAAGTYITIKKFEFMYFNIDANPVHVQYHRSAAVVMAYLIKEQNKTVEEALVMVKKNRDVRPNDAFLQQLIGLDTQKNMLV